MLSVFFRWGRDNHQNSVSFPGHCFAVSHTQPGWCTSYCVFSKSCWQISLPGYQTGGCPKQPLHTRLHTCCVQPEMVEGRSSRWELMHDQTTPHTGSNTELMCVCVCVRVRVRRAQRDSSARERERERERERVCGCACMPTFSFSCLYVTVSLIHSSS